MPGYFLRVEAVNLASVLDDTDDLSTRRGGGLMLLNAVKELKGFAIDEIATGASIGLFSFNAASEEEAEAEKVRDQVRDHFRSGMLAHGTFVVDVVDTEGRTALEAYDLATARNRWRQMQEPCLSLAELWNGATTDCYLNRLRPGAVPGNIPDHEKELVSRSVFDRRAYGKDARQRFYDREVKAELGLSFTTEFNDIGDPRDLSDDDAPANTHDKLAVFYVDGNLFGKKSRKALDIGVEAYQAWSSDLRGHHSTLLKELLLRAKDQPAWKNGEMIRLETLLWGGDEIVFVVPAWKGWELVEWFFSHKHEVKLNEKLTPLTYACGLVFCHTKAPIKNVIDLAKKLGDKAKKLNPKDANPDQLKHAIAYEVLESFDDVTNDLDEHRRKWLPRSLDVQQLLFTPPQQPTPPQPDFWAALRAIAACPDFPMRQLYMLCKAWRKGEPTATHEKRLRDNGAPLDTFLKQFPEESVAWLHLLQMLPYTPTPKTEAQP